MVYVVGRMNERFVVAACFAILFFAVTAAAQEDSVRALSGKEIVAQRCTVCHSQSRIDNARKQKSRAQWEGTVDRMIAKGAQVNKAERALLLDDLSGGNGNNQ